ncbi:MAG: hypothetical protein SNJ60_07260 [Pseudanabaenaceae cyanobacterium]
MTARKRLTDLVREEAGKDLETSPLEPNPKPDADAGDEVAALQARIQELETELAAQKQYVAQMKEYLNLASQLKTELERVQAENAQLQSRLQAQSKPPTAIAPSTPAYRVSKLARRPVGSHSQQTQENNRNIGWMD